MLDRRRVAYYFDPDVGGYSYGNYPDGIKDPVSHYMKPHRIAMTHNLISAYNMLEKMQVLRAKRATAEQMTRFHTDEYVQFLSRIATNSPDERGIAQFLRGDDNPVFDGVFEFCSISAGGSIAAANRVASGSADIAINWAGGLHHAKKREASGFCYINDIVLGILELLRIYPRVLYIDIDCHHGDGVEEAFYTTDRVMTCSFHKFGEYFPGTGDVMDIGKGKGKGYCVNVPLRAGITDEIYKSLFEPIVSKVLEVFQPSAVVLQCGADSLSGDRLGMLNLTMQGHASCVQFLRKKNIPLMLLGGGGYTVKNVARAWCYETACALGIEDTLDLRLPYNPHFEFFGPRYRLEVMSNTMDDQNLIGGYIDELRTKVLNRLSRLQPAPSVGMHDVPRESVGEHLGWHMEPDDPEDDLDRSLAQHARFVYNVQESLARDDTDEDDDSVRVPVKKRMSIITNRVLDIPQHRDFEDEHAIYCGDIDKRTRRRFFEYPSPGDENTGWRVPDAVVEAHTSPGIQTTRYDIGGVMSRGGREEDLDTEDDAI
ncbi:histone deacetylase RPD3 [Neolentinus lepideus HHB14362 ss-1]|uniref:Histone deacetylase n=1 Tax=Neolentinus lepideus HHB14362 ss-1 TaxID=1314782 RepID=A0A165QZC3_9AGAM|nr:histone deacetylase RPD3 [Neolentinus lepideus HHB14362 ss-1]